MSTQIKGNKGEQIITTKTDERVMSLKPKTVKTLENGKNATTMQGGYEVPIMFKEVLAGEKIESWSIDNITRIITPLVPTFDRVYMTVKAFFVPHTRVWDNAEKTLAFGEGRSTMELEETGVPYGTLESNNTFNPYFKEHLASRYGISNQSSDTEISMLLLRGYRAIQNDFLRVKEYEPEYREWKDSNATTNNEYEMINWCNSRTETMPYDEYDRNAYRLAKAKARKSYWNNLKKQMYAGNVDDNLSGIEVYEHLDWQNRYNDAKKAQLDIEKNPWDIIAEMGGTQPVRADRIELLGIMDYELNYQQITQSAPQIDNSSPLGTQGGFSYTRAQGTLFNGKEFNQAGYIHILVNLNMDHIFEGNAPKEMLKTKISDYYRPALAEKEYQVMYDREISNQSGFVSGAAVAYQPAWEEYNRLPSYASGEMQTKRLEEIGWASEPITNSQWHNMFLYGTGQIVVDEDYFKPADLINSVLARNNVANTTWSGDRYAFTDDPIFLMSEHKVKTSLPIYSNILTGTDKANEDR